MDLLNTSKAGNFVYASVDRLNINVGSIFYHDIRQELR